MVQLKRVRSPFRFQIPDDLVPDFRSLRARQRNWSELIDAEDVVHLFYGLGPGRFLAFDGRVLVDPIDWDGTEPYEVVNPKEAWSAIVVGASIWSFPPFLRLLPPRPWDAVDCSQCTGKGWISWVDAAGKPGRVVCWDGCGGLGWVYSKSSMSAEVKADRAKRGT